jgi:hypothetical protein
MDRPNDATPVQKTKPVAEGAAVSSVPEDAAVPEASPVREVAALHRFEVFLFTAIATVLVVRALLAVTGYPKIGGGGLHIAHVLWGGLAMAVAVVMGLAGLGSRIRTWAAFIGGIGFGLSSTRSASSSRPTSTTSTHRPSR